MAADSVAHAPRHERTTHMPEATTPTKPKSKPAVAPFTGETPKFDTPMFEMPKFDIPSFEVPAAFREFAEKGVSQAKANWEKVKAATEETTDLLEDSYSTASKGAAEFGLKMIKVSRANTNSAFDFASQMMTVKTLSEAVELSTAFARKQFDAMGEQGKELSALAQKVTTETIEPIKEGVTSAFKKVA
jgi:phasin